MGGAETRIGPLDGLRAASILLVLAAHLLPLGPKGLAVNAMAGVMGMSLFFVLSGFLIARAAGREPLRAFVLKRLARIVPLAYVYIGVVALIHGAAPEALAAQLLFVINYSEPLMIAQTQHLWSLCVEIHFYACVALVMLIDRRALLLVWPACLAVTAVRIAEGGEQSILTHLRVDEILIGACVALLPGSVRARLGWGHGRLVAAAAFWAACCHVEAGFLQYLRPYATGVLLVLILNAKEGFVVRTLSSAPLRYVARISYALYVIHPLFAHGWWNAGDLAERYLLKRPLGILATFLLAHLSTFHWERFWMDAARRVGAGRAASAREPAVRPAPAAAAGGNSDGGGAAKP